MACNAGTISWVEFCSAVVYLAKKSSCFGDVWEVVRPSDNPEVVYLRKNVTLRLPLKEEPQNDGAFLSDEATGTQMSNDEKDSLSLERPVGTRRGMMCQFEYHVIYSESYAVPVLYFNAYKSDGGLLTLEEIWNSVPAEYQERLKQERWTFISQQEHPILGRPFYQLHPCHTSSLMEAVPRQDTDNRRYLIAWLSAVGPVVHLNLPLQYGLTEGHDNDIT